MKKAKWKQLEVEMYGFDVFFAFGRAKTIEKKIRKAGYSISPMHREELLGGYEGVAFPMLHKRGYNAFLMWIPTKPKSPKEIAVVAHECLHLVNYVFAEIGVHSVPEPVDELQTYFLDYLVEEALRYYWNR